MITLMAIMPECLAGFSTWREAGIVLYIYIKRRSYGIHPGRQVPANQPDIVVVDKNRKLALVTDIVIPYDRNVRKN